MISKYFFHSYLFLSLLIFGHVDGQNSVISNIHDIEPVKNHYAEFKVLSSTQNPENEQLASLAFPPELYSSRALLYAMTKPVYLTSDQVSFLKKSVKYPANSSEQTRAELDFLLDWQYKRSDQEIERVLDLAKIGYWPNANYISSHNNYQKNLDALFFECKEIVGGHCTDANYPATSKLLQGVMNDMRLMEFVVKFHHLRARPYQLELKLEPLKKINSPSFASGHTLWAYIQAYTFSELMPSRRKEFVNLAYEIGLSREIMGVHYPSDEEAARQLAHRMLSLMWNTQKFQDDFKDAKKEWE